MNRWICCLFLILKCLPAAAQTHPRENGWQEGRAELLTNISQSVQKMEPYPIDSQQVPQLLVYFQQISQLSELSKAVQNGTASSAERAKLDEIAKAAGFKNYEAGRTAMQSLVFSYLALYEKEKGPNLLQLLDQVSACMDTMFICARSEEEWKSTMVSSFTVRQAEFSMRMFALIIQKNETNIAALAANRKEVEQVLKNSLEVRHFIKLFDNSTVMQREICTEARTRAASCGYK